MTQTATDIDTRPLPAGWKWVKLRDAAEVVNGFAFKTSLQGHNELPYPFIKVSDMNAEGSELIISFAANTVDEPILKQLHAKLYPAGTVVFPKVGGALLTNKKRMLGALATFDNNVMGIVPGDATSEWIYYWMLTIDLASLANTQALPSIRKSDIETLAFPLPPIEEQKRIAAILNEQMAAVEKAKKAAEERLEAAKALPAAYLREVIPSEEDELPPDWDWVTLGDFCDLVTGNTPSRSNPSFYGGDTPWANPSNLNGGLIITETNEYLTNAGVNKSRPVPPGSILMTCISGALRHIGKMGIAGVQLTTNQQITSLVPKEGLDSMFAYYSMRTMKPVLESLAASTNQNILNKSKLSSVCFGIPSLGEQRLISTELDEKLAEIASAEESIQQELDTIEAMPAALLRKAFSGEL